MPIKEKAQVKWLKNYMRYTNYISAAQLYLKDNFLLEEDLKVEHIKKRILGHWGTVPGLNLIYGSLNYLVSKNNCEVLFITGPGHGAPSILSNLFAEETLASFYPEYKLNKKGMAKIIKDFSWPYSKFPSHVTPSVPGSILEGGELGYSLSTAFGAALDNPKLIVAVVVGDGESESGPLAAAWNSNKFLNPKTSGAVLPIVHANGYKISNPTIFGTMSDSEVTNYFTGLGYEPIIVRGTNLEEKTLEAVEKAYKKIIDIQIKARKSKQAILKPKWPMIFLRSKKGMSGPKEYMGHPVENSFYSHGIPIEHIKSEPDALKTIEKWLRSYKVQELLEKDGKPKKEILQFVPKGKLRIGMNKHAIGGSQLKKLKIPRLSTYESKFKKRGSKDASSMVQASKFYKDLFKTNKDNFRMFCPDELVSNRLSEVFKQTNRAYMWPIPENAEHIAPDGRVMEMLSEHTLQGWMQGYLLTGRYGTFVSYEAFTTIINSMVDQYAKFLKQSFSIKWRTPISSAIYIQSSVLWRQDHNGFSHQNPSFVSNLLQKHGEFCQIYYPADANSMLVALEETLNRKDSICAIVAGKRDLPQWLSIKEAREQAKVGIGIWEWVGGKDASKNPDVVLASAGDYITQEALFAVKLVNKLAPEIKIRYVNISELTSIGLGDYCNNPNACTTESAINKYFTTDKPVIFSYHGYKNDIEQILWPYTSSHRFTLRGYSEFGSTTTPFDIMIRNGVSRYQVAKDIIEQAAKTNKSLAKKCNKLLAEIQQKIEDHQNYICETGDDPNEIKDMNW